MTRLHVNFNFTRIVRSSWNCDENFLVRKWKSSWSQSDSRVWFSPGLLAHILTRTEVTPEGLAGEVSCSGLGVGVSADSLWLRLKLAPESRQQIDKTGQRWTLLCLFQDSADRGSGRQSRERRRQGGRIWFSGSFRVSLGHYAVCLLILDQ